MEFNTAEVRALPLTLPRVRRQVEDFLSRFELKLDRVDYYAGLFIGDQLVAGGGYQGSVIKCVAVDPEKRDMGLTNTLVTHLRSELRAKGAGNIFVFTKPENREIFESLAFHTIGQAPRAILLESSRRGIADFCRGLNPQPGRSGAIVMNANPFTLGHQYLVETAAARCDHLHLFVVEEDQSVFPFPVRLELIRRGTAHLPNVHVHPGGPYIISGATFPTYFIKEADDLLETYTLLDMDIFCRHIVPALDLTTRFAGEEPLDPVTAAYNAAMAARLPEAGVEFVVIPRKARSGAPISASRVRGLIRAGELDAVRELVPETTYAYLQSGEAEPVLEKIRSGDT